MQLSVALQGIVTQQLLPTADGSGRAPSPARCSCPTPAVRNLIREGKTHQIYSVLQTGSAQGMQTMDTALAGARALGQDHPDSSPKSRSSTPAGAAPPARRRLAGGLGVR